MAILSKGTDFTTGDQVTAAKLDALVDSATFASGAVDDSTTQLDGSGRIIVKDGGITAAKLNLNDGVTINDNTLFLTFNNNSQDVGFIGTDSGTGNFFIDAGGSTDELVLKTNGNSILTAVQSGKVGIGTSDPDEQLTVQAGSFGNDQDGGIAVQLGSESGSHFKTAFKCKTDGSGNPRTAIDAPLSSTGGTTQEAI